MCLTLAFGQIFVRSGVRALYNNSPTVGSGLKGEYETRLETLAMNKRSSLIRLFVSDAKICFKTLGHSGQYYELFTAVITPLAAYLSMILTELQQ